MKESSMGIFGIVFVFAIFIAGLYGWVMNIVAIIAADTLGGMVIVRAIGIFVAPLGAVLGYF